MIDGQHEMNLALSAHVRNWSCKFCDLICVRLYIHFVTVLSAIPPSFSLSVVTEESDSYGPKVGPLSVTLKFTYTANYPDEIPLFEVIDSDGLPDDTDNDEIIELSRTQVRSMDCFTMYRTKHQSCSHACGSTSFFPKCQLIQMFSYGF